MSSKMHYYDEMRALAPEYQHPETSEARIMVYNYRRGLLEMRVPILNKRTKDRLKRYNRLMQERGIELGRPQQEVTAQVKDMTVRYLNHLVSFLNKNREGISFFLDEANIVNYIRPLPLVYATEPNLDAHDILIYTEDKIEYMMDFLIDRGGVLFERLA